MNFLKMCTKCDFILFPTQIFEDQLLRKGVVLAAADLMPGRGAVADELHLSLFADGSGGLSAAGLFIPCVYVSGLRSVNSTHSQSAYKEEGERERM